MQVFDQLPCAVLVTDGAGRVLDVNAELLMLVGGQRERWVGYSMEALLPPASRIFLQTHVWPTLLRDGRITEIHLQVLGDRQERLPVLLNGRLGQHEQHPAYYWCLFSALERHRFEGELVKQRNRAESAARAVEASQRFVKTVTDATPGMVGYWGKDLRCRFANQAYVAWFGRRPEDVVGLSLRELLGEELFALNEPHVLAALAGQEQNFERTLTRADGSIGHTLAHYVPDAVEGEIRGFFVKVDDVTQLKQTQVALQEAHERLRAMYETTPAMLHSIDGQGRLLHVSDAWLARLGYLRDEVIGRLSSDFLTETSRRYARDEVLPAFFSTGRCDEVSYQMLTRDGETVDVLLSAILERDAQGHAGRSLAVIKDVTLRRRAERELAKEHERLRNLIEGTHAGTWEWNVQTGEVLVNRRWAEIIGWQPEDLPVVTNQFRADIAHPDELPHTRQLLREHFAGRSDTYLTEVRLRHRNGHWVWVEDRGRLITRTADGRPEWVFGIQIDISERKRRDEALRRSEALLNRTGEVAGVGGWELDLERGVLTWSAQTRRIHGVADDYEPSLDAAIGFFASEAQAMMRGAVEAAIAGGRRWDVEVPLIQAGGQRLQVRSVGHVEFDEGGRALRLLGAFQDMTEAVEQRRALQAAHQRMALAADSGGIAVWDIDLETQRLTVDSWMVRLYELPPGRTHVPADLWHLRVHPEDRRAVALALATALERQRVLETEFRILCPQQGLRHMRVAARITRDDHGQALAMVGVSWDVTALRQLSAELAQQHELLRVTLQSIGEAVITTDATGLVSWLNPAAERMTGWPLAEAQRQPLLVVFRIVNEKTREPAPDPVAGCLAEGGVDGVAHHTLLISRGGAEYGIQESAAPIRNPLGEVLGVVLVFHDVSEQRRHSGEMTYRATHDALTGLVNRAEFEARLLRALRHAQEEGSHHALLCIDLDHFKPVNDACGHAAGDRLLQQVSKMLGDAVRGRDTLARLGGDEFGIILEHCGIDQALRVAQKICDRMDQFRFTHEDRRFRIGTSIGLVPVDKRWSSTAVLQQAGDSACYAAKEAGRNRVHAWFDSDAAMRTRQAEVQWSTRIERALDDAGFTLYAQRIEALGDTQPGLRAEVLLRMANEDGSVTLPGAFLPAAERFNLATRIDRWVLAAVAARLQAMPSLEAIGQLSVNLSARSIGDRRFHSWVVQLLDQLGPEVCRRLCVEIAENVAVANPVDAAEFIQLVRQRGVKVALDDFGAGASSFGYLKSLPVDILKIDGQFAMQLLDDPLNDAAVRCFVDVARVVGVRTVAEFVERQGVKLRLRAMGVDDAQGDFIHRPEPLDRMLPVCAPATA
jgi:diguanylate cyclase